jgi:hypothetical protein
MHEVSSKNYDSRLYTIHPPVMLAGSYPNAVSGAPDKNASTCFNGHFNTKPNQTIYSSRIFGDAGIDRTSTASSAAFVRDR